MEEESLPFFYFEASSIYLTPCIVPHPPLHKTLVSGPVMLYPFAVVLIIIRKLTTNASTAGLRYRYGLLARIGNAYKGYNKNSSFERVALTLNFG